ncbi:hypothetical protein ERO13_D02G188650v2 [Gossypium hirsutum]|uniref:Uncharacterized protein n=1 Tax=Gossypium tomentosum TaxID=34277 RepID=A0A5D2M114_GOSTO|nr:hypothetical protein ERO13_D02G188650v2 [Gossypium hirsutum]TYH85004.1 hypothetical protein ES332_D02G235800v1 [Gossypium tomentosum]
MKYAKPTTNLISKASHLRHTLWISKEHMDFKKAHEELNVLLPFNPNVKVQHAQREQLAVAKLEVTKSQILSRSKIISLQDTFMRVLRIESSNLVQTNNRVLVSKGVIVAVRRWGESCDIIVMSQAILSISV